MDRKSSKKKKPCLTWKMAVPRRRMALACSETRLLRMTSLRLSHLGQVLFSHEVRVALPLVAMSDVKMVV